MKCDSIYMKQRSYGYSLQSTIGAVLKDPKRIIINPDAKEGYIINISDQDLESKGKSLNGTKTLDLIITCERNLSSKTHDNPDTILGKIYLCDKLNNYKTEFPANSCREFLDAEEKIIAYISEGNGKWVLPDNK